MGYIMAQTVAKHDNGAEVVTSLRVLARQVRGECIVTDDGQRFLDQLPTDDARARTLADWHRA